MNQYPDGLCLFGVGIGVLSAFLGLIPEERGPPKGGNRHGQKRKKVHSSYENCCNRSTLAIRPFQSICEVIKVYCADKNSEKDCIYRCYACRELWVTRDPTLAKQGHYGAAMRTERTSP